MKSSGYYGFCKDHSGVVLSEDPIIAKQVTEIVRETIAAFKF